MKIFRAEKMFSLPYHLGKGTVHQLRITPDVSLVCWNVFLLKGESFRSMFPTEKVALHLVYAFSSRFFRTAPVATPGPAYLLLANSRQQLEYHFSSGHHVYCIEIFLTNPGTQSSAAYDEVMYKIKQLTDGESQDAISLPVPNGTHHALHDLFQYAYKDVVNTAYAESKLLSVLTDLLLIAEEKKRIVNSNAHISEKMMQINAWLDQYIETELPPLKSLADSMSMSVSSLNRQFKAFHGNSIYEVYLEKKMRRAKEMLNEPFITVNEIAYKLGYEKVSNFITIFKRFYQQSPGKFKKKK